MCSMYLYWKCILCHEDLPTPYSAVQNALRTVCQSSRPSLDDNAEPYPADSGPDDLSMHHMQVSDRPNLSSSQDDSTLRCGCSGSIKSFYVARRRATQLNGHWYCTRATLLYLYAEILPRYAMPPALPVLRSTANLSIRPPVC